MMENNESKEYVSTDVFAAANGVKAQSVRTRYCLKGSYFGVVPKKRRNGLLGWPNPNDEQVKQRMFVGGKAA
jgi:hypothetical protein